MGSSRGCDWCRARNAMGAHRCVCTVVSAASMSTPARGVGAHCGVLSHRWTLLLLRGSSLHTPPWCFHHRRQCFKGALGSGKAAAGGAAAAAAGSGRQGEAAAASGSGRAEREDPLREPAGGQVGRGSAALLQLCV